MGIIDYDAMLYGPIYAALAVPALLDLGTSGTVTLNVLDKTEGVMLDEGNGLQIGTISPAAIVRLSELTANNLTRASIKGLPISFNNNDWTIIATQPKPNPNGDGELYLKLEKA